MKGIGGMYHRSAQLIFRLIRSPRHECGSHSFVDAFPTRAAKVQYTRDRLHENICGQALEWMLLLSSMLCSAIGAMVVLFAP